MDLTAVVLGLHLFSFHSAPGFNDVNPGVYAQFDNGVTVGTYFNSERRQTFYAGKTFNLYGPIDLTVGVITGYSAASVLPMAVPSARVRLGERVNLRVAYVPKIEKRGAHAVSFMIERRF